MADENRTRSAQSERDPELAEEWQEKVLENRLKLIKLSSRSVLWWKNPKKSSTPSERRLVTSSLWPTWVDLNLAGCSLHLPRNDMPRNLCRVAANLYMYR